MDGTIEAFLQIKICYTPDKKSSGIYGQIVQKYSPTLGIQTSFGIHILISATVKASDFKFSAI